LVIGIFLSLHFEEASRGKDPAFSAASDDA
jgi:hypothetical protein